MLKSLIYDESAFSILFVTYMICSGQTEYARLSIFEVGKEIMELTRPINPQIYPPHPLKLLSLQYIDNPCEIFFGRIELHIHV